MPTTPLPFADADELGTRLQRTWDSTQRAAVTAMLEDASAYLRWDVIGQQVYPAVRASFKVRLHCPGSVRLPAQPVVSVDAVKVNGDEVAVDTDGVTVEVGRPGLVEVTFTFGYQEPPANLAMWACVLASQAVQLVEELGQLGGGGVSSFSIDDYRKAWGGNGDGTGYALPQRQIDSLRQQYGDAGVTVTGARP